MKSTRLFKQSARGDLQVWEIYSDDDVIYIQWGAEDGVMQTQEEEVEDGLGGRTLEEQIQSRIESRINKKLDRGYVRSKVHAAKNKPVNRMGFKKPMLATRFDKIRDVNYDGAMAQLKYDGHRCLIHYDGTDFTAYSRGGKPITAITEILSSVRMSGLLPDYTLDGELYHHGTKLQTISSWVKRRQAMTSNLEYVVYDVITDDEDLYYSERYSYLQSLNFARNFRIAETDLEVEKARVPFMLESAVKAGYEGIIIRQDKFPYQDDKRSKGLVKVKAWEDCEFRVTEINPSKEGYAILTCITEAGIKFEATAPGDMVTKHRTMSYQHEYIGKFVNVQFAFFTNAGKPFQPIATGWREKGD